MVDSGKVSRVSENAVIEGTQLLFYPGEWTIDGERVRSLFDVRSETDLPELDCTRSFKGSITRFSEGKSNDRPMTILSLSGSSAALQRVDRSLPQPSTSEHPQLRWTYYYKRRRLFSMSHLLL